MRIRHLRRLGGQRVRKDTASDLNNCGNCWVICQGTNASPLCVAGACDNVCDNVCNNGFEDCDGNAINGCETSLVPFPVIEFCVEDSGHNYFQIKDFRQDDRRYI